MMWKTMVVMLSLVVGLLAGVGQAALADAIPNLTGDWAFHDLVVGWQVTLTLQHDGNQLTGTVFDDPIENGRVLPDGTVSFKRTGQDQTFTATFSVEPDGTWKLSGIYTGGRIGTRKWEATRPASAETPPTTTPPATGVDLTTYRGRTGAISFDITGTTTGKVYGIAGVYTDHSHLATAAVHAGILRAGERSTVWVEMLPGRDRYSGSHPGLPVNGVVSSEHGAWPGSFRFVRTIPWMPDTLFSGQYRLELGTTFEFKVTGATTGTIWGTGVYTDNSHLGTAAVHAGLLEPGEMKVLKIIMLRGRESFEGTTANGVTSNEYGHFPYAYTFVDEQR
jgi:hypothetical protein